MDACVNCYFTSKEYYFTDGIGIDAYFKLSTEFNYLSAYQKRYITLMIMLTDLIKMQIKNVHIYNNSRIIEEIERFMSPLSSFGQEYRRDICRNLLPYFIDIAFSKKPLEELRTIIRDGEKKIGDCDQDIGKQEILNQRSRRLKRFKNASSKRQGEKKQKIQT